jgi:putative MFS transporter
VPTPDFDNPMARRMDNLPLTRLHVFLLIVCTLGFAFDLMEMAMGGALSAVFSAPPHVLPSQHLAWLLASTYVGAVIGAPLLGWLGDRLGRKRVLGWVLLWLAWTSIAAASSRGPTELSVMRGLSGVALGAYPPLMLAYLADMLPPARRGMLILVVSGLAILGAPAAIFLVRTLTPWQPLEIEAWRWALGLGGLGAGVLGLLFTALPESPRWLLTRGRLALAESLYRRFETSKVVLPAKPPKPPRGASDSLPRVSGSRFALLGALFFLSPWSTVAFPLLSGAVLMSKGFRLTDTLLYVGVANFGPMIGALLAAGAIDRIERRSSLAICVLAMGVAGLIFALADAPLWLVMASLLFMLAGSLYVPTLNMYSAELLPSATRAGTLASAWAFNRIGAALAPLLLLPLLQSAGVSAMFIAIGLTLGGTLLLLWIAPAGMARRRLG